MSEDGMNGKAAPPAAAEEELPGLTEAQLAKSEQDAREAVGANLTPMQQGEAALDANVHLIMLTVFSGMCASTRLPPDVIWRSVMRVCGRLVGTTIIGMLGPVLAVRKGVKDALIDTMKEMPVKGPPEPAKAGMTALPPGILRS